MCGQLIYFPWRAYTARSTSPTEKNYLIIKHKIIFPLRSIIENSNIRTDAVFENEANRETNKNESFADDANNFTTLSLNSLARLKEILSLFKKLSGISCNVEKTCVMRIGNLEGEIPDDVKNLGFSFVEEMVLLGFTLSSTENMSLINFNPIIGKLQNSIRYWERFYLSLPGKITVYKCLLLSQLSYKASILKPDQNTVSTISDMFEKFILNGMTFSKDRLQYTDRYGREVWA
jgi:hypothetical protein